MHLKSRGSMAVVISTMMVDLSSSSCPVPLRFAMTSLRRPTYLLNDLGSPGFTFGRLVIMAVMAFASRPGCPYLRLQRLVVMAKLG